MTDLTDNQHRLHHAWTEHLKSLAAEFGVSEQHGDELFEALSVFCSQLVPEGHIRNEALGIMMARVLYSLGHEKDAEQVLQHSGGTYPERWSDLIEADEVRASIWPFVASGIVRPGRLFSFAGDPLWVIDLRCLAADAANLHEMIICRVVRRLLETVHLLWNRSSGKGILGICGAHRLMPASEDFKAELTAYIRNVLATLSRKENWKHIPEIRLMELDAI